MKIAIYGQSYQDNALKYVFELLEELAKMEATVAIEEEFYGLISAQRPESKYNTFDHTTGLDASFDLFVSFGGDGTILRAVTFVGDLGIPI
ncbi:MAG: NAD(+) kinase, partial [Eudoraea sp.]|nr:NAD(+) kinase [Eudoraea sp.]